VSRSSPLPRNRLAPILTAMRIVEWGRFDAMDSVLRRLVDEGRELMGEPRSRGAMRSSSSGSGRIRGT
jgi:hypothetical protein